MTTQGRAINQAHDKAMEYLDEALLFKLRGDHDAQNAYIWKAMIWEVRAAYLALKTNIEPSRSVLCRSAAQLCVDCGETREAESLITRALAGTPPAEIARELQDIRKQIANLGLGAANP